MSRTYRRKKNTRRRYDQLWAISDWVRPEGTWHFILVRKEGDELKKALAIYHSDRDYNASPTPWWRKNEWRKIKAQEKQELIRWMKNPDYEVQMHEQPKWPWWD